MLENRKVYECKRNGKKVYCFYNGYHYKGGVSPCSMLGTYKVYELVYLEEDKNAPLGYDVVDSDNPYEDVREVNADTYANRCGDEFTNWRVVATW